MKLLLSFLFVIFGLASTACMTETDRLIFQEVFHGDKTDTAVAAASPNEHEVKPTEESKGTKAADASELDEEAPEPSVEAS